MARLETEVTRRRVEDPRSLRLIDSSISAAQRGAKLIAQLMAFARKQNLQMEFLPLNTLVREMQELLERSVGAAVALTYELAPDAWPVMADAKDKVKKAIDNTADKAKEATDKVAEKSKEAAKTVGQKVKETGQKIKDAGK